MKSTHDALRRCVANARRQLREPALEAGPEEAGQAAIALGAVERRRRRPRIQHPGAGLSEGVYRVTATSDDGASVTDIVTAVEVG